jgi:hypothetical protein
MIDALLVILTAALATVVMLLVCDWMDKNLRG